MIDPWMVFAAGSPSQRSAAQKNPRLAAGIMAGPASESAGSVSNLKLVRHRLAVGSCGRVLHALDPLLEAAQPLAEGCPHLGKLACAEDNEDQDENDHEFAGAETFCTQMRLLQKS